MEEFIRNLAKARRAGTLSEHDAMKELLDFNDFLEAYENAGLDVALRDRVIPKRDLHNVIKDGLITTDEELRALLVYSGRRPQRV